MSERTPQDFAIEHAEYMAQSAEHLIVAVNDLALAEQEHENGSANSSDVDAARDNLTEMLSDTRSSIYEFRKRRDRALAAPTAPAPTEPVADKLADRALAKSFRENPREASLVDQASMRRAISDPLTNRAFNMDGCTPPSAAQPEAVGCACRWDKDDNRVQTCERHQGWLDVVHEWAERAKDAERRLAAAPTTEATPPAPTRIVDKSELKRLVTQVFGEEFQIVRQAEQAGPGFVMVPVEPKPLFGEMIAAHPGLREELQAEQARPGFTLDDLADACVQAEIPDSKYESLCIALEAARPSEPPKAPVEPVGELPCKQCGVDRLKKPCPLGRFNLNCPMNAIANGTKGTT